VPRTLNVFPAHLGKPDFVPFADPWSSGLGAAALWAKNNRIKQRAVLGSAVADWATYQNSRESLRIVSGLAENPHSIFCDGRQGLRQRMDVRFCKAGATAERLRIVLCGFALYRSVAESRGRGVWRNDAQMESASEDCRKETFAAERWTAGGKRPGLVI